MQRTSKHQTFVYLEALKQFYSCIGGGTFIWTIQVLNCIIDFGVVGVMLLLSHEDLSQGYSKDAITLM
jgi:hypothetical protein